MELYTLAILIGLVTVASSCGKTSFPAPNLIQSYIVGGQTAQEGDFPWQIGLIQNGYLICGGTYVAGSDGSVKVITAAHCIGSKRPNPSDFAVVFGMHQQSKTGTRRILDVLTIEVHANYNDRTMANDIAVIGFAGDADALVSDTWATPACLASGDYSHNEISLVSGWGTTSSGGSVSDTLRYVYKPVLSQAACEQTQNGGHLDNTMMCAGEAYKDACQGDSGGPLVAYRSGAWELIGVVSWGFGCGSPNAPGVYADVWNLRSWLASKL